LASGNEEHRELPKEMSSHEPPLMPPVAVCEPDLPPVRDSVPLPGPPPVRDMMPAAEPFGRFSPPPPFDEPFTPV